MRRPRWMSATRSSTRTANRAARSRACPITGQIFQVRASNSNIGSLSVEGVDLTLDYTFDLPQAVASVTSGRKSRWCCSTGWLFERESQIIGAPPIDCAGFFGSCTSQGAGGSPDFKALFVATFDSGPLMLRAQVRYIDGLDPLPSIAASTPVVADADHLRRLFSGLYASMTHSRSMRASTMRSTKIRRCSPRAGAATPTRMSRCTTSSGAATSWDCACISDAEARAVPRWRGRFAQSCASTCGRHSSASMGTPPATRCDWSPAARRCCAARPWPSDGSISWSDSTGSAPACASSRAGTT